MEPRLLAALVASLVSQALLFLLIPLPFPSLPFTNSNHLPPPPNPFLPLLFHLLSSSQIAATSFLLPRKRKRQLSPQEEDGGEVLEEEAAALPTTVLVPLRANPDHFKLWFRMSSSTFEWLSGLLDPLLDCRDPAGSSLRLPGPTRLAIALSRLAAGVSYSDIARHFAVSEGAARFCAKHLCRVLCTNFRFWLAFPSPAELRPISAAFQSLAGDLPDCCGAVACARFEVSGGRSVAAQIVADASSRILSIAAGFRGERGDGAVLRCSSFYKDVEEGRLLGCSQYLVGDSGYPLLPWLMVPFADPALGSIEEDFNTVHHLMCQPAQRAVASLRNWGVLSRLMEEEDGKVAVACIGTCAILHNVLLMREDYSALSDVSSKESLLSLDKDGEGVVEGLEECFAKEKKASVVRSALAVRARVIRDAGHLVCSS